MLISGSKISDSVCVAKRKSQKEVAWNWTSTKRGRSRRNLVILQSCLEKRVLIEVAWTGKNNSKGGFYESIHVMIVNQILSFFSISILQTLPIEVFTTRVEPKIAGVLREQLNFLLNIFMFPRLLGRHHYIKSLRIPNIWFLIQRGSTVSMSIFLFFCFSSLSLRQGNISSPFEDALTREDVLFHHRVSWAINENGLHQCWDLLATTFQLIP